jgi:uncharacterized protein with NAD-binding domain and iron-sulfur cluster
MAKRTKTFPVEPSSIPDWDQLPESPNCVTIFGAGIAGLTAAHELVERGFHVQVWEKASDERHPDRGCDVGGLARTQWAAVTWPEARRVDVLEDPVDKRDWPSRRTTSVTFVPERFYLRFAPGRFERDDPWEKPDPDAWLELAKVVEELVSERPPGANHCTITVRAQGGLEISGAERFRRAEYCRGLVAACLRPKGYVVGELQGFTPWLELCCSVTREGEEFRVQIVVTGSDQYDYAGVEIDWRGGADRKTKLRPLLATSRWRRHWAPEDLSSVTGNFLKDLSTALGRLEGQFDGQTVYFEASANQISRLGHEERERRIRYVKDMFQSRLPGTIAAEGSAYRVTWTSDSKDAVTTSVLVHVVPIDRFPYQAYDDVPEDIEVACSFRPRERWLPGEHGYRFFPSFYHHLFDTMKRTPLLEAMEKPAFSQAQERAVGVRHPEPFEYTETGRVVMDNVHPTTSTLLAFSGGQRPSRVSRSAVRSFEELREYLEVLFGAREAGGLGFTPRDATRMSLKILKFATASDARRREYEDISWWDFLDADTLSEGAQDTIRRLPQALVAMNAEECDARTQWVPFIHILLDEVRTDAYRDGTLRGPTSEAWLLPWRRYLEAQGVEFVRGELEGFELVEREVGARDVTAVGERDVEAKRVRRPWPKVHCFDLRYPCQEDRSEADEAGKPKRRPLLRPGYFVLSVSADRTKALADEYAALAAKLSVDEQARFRLDGSDLELARSITSPPPLGPEHEEAKLGSDFRHFSGIQYYFAEDVFWIDGHVYFPDSAWRVTSISQARFWQEKMDWEHGYRGVLSAIIGNWDEPGSLKGKKAWECTEAELAEEVWYQIKSAIREKRARRGDDPGRFARRTPAQDELPEPLYWHLDAGLKPRERAPGFENATPFMVNRPGAFEQRPGSLDPERGYTVEHGFVLAGYYTKTHTRIPSMEAANESARHAVNAILKHLERSGAEGLRIRRTYCDVWSPEDRELDDLRFLKELDARLLERGLPHLLDIFDADYLAQHLLRGGSRDPLDPLRLLSRLRRLYRDVAE